MNERLMQIKFINIIVPLARRWGPAILVMVTMFILSSNPTSVISDNHLIDTLYKKAGHVVGYALLAASFAWALQPERSGSYLSAILLAVLFAISDEIHQSYTPGRTPSAVDVLIDTLGAAAGLLLYHRLRFGRITRPPDDPIQSK